MTVQEVSFRPFWHSAGSIWTRGGEGFKPQPVSREEAWGLLMEHTRNVEDAVRAGDALMVGQSKRVATALYDAIQDEADWRKASAPYVPALRLVGEEA